MPPKRRSQEGSSSSLWLYAATSMPPRRKACLQCFEAKVRCDHKRPVCSRCARRAMQCDYTGAGSEELQRREATASAFHLNMERTSSAPMPDPSATVTSLPHAGHGTPFTNPTALFAPFHDPPRPELSNALSTVEINPSSDFNIHLLCTVDAERVRDRWLGGWVPRIGQQPKDLTRGTAVFIYNILKSYQQALCKDSLPPIIHGLQIVDGKLPDALANCVSIARMWEGQEVGGSQFVKDTTMREMERLFTEKQNYKQHDLLAAFQAYIFYVTLLLNPATEPVISQSIMLNLQEFAHSIALTGLVHHSEHRSDLTQPTRPPWRAWALAEAKRRSLFTMYMLDDVVNTFSNVSCILGDELSDLLAPCSEKLWRTNDETVWCRLYDVYVAEWEGGGLRLNELWPTREEKDARRVERWVREMDGLGMMVYAVTTGTQYR